MSAKAIAAPFQSSSDVELAELHFFLGEIYYWRPGATKRALKDFRNATRSHLPSSPEYLMARYRLRTTKKG